MKPGPILHWPRNHTEDTEWKRKISPYHQALFREFELQGLRAESQRALEVTYKEKPVGLYAEAILVEDHVVVELKTVESLATAHEAQLLNYLKASGKRAGLFVNFAHPKVEIRRFIL